MHNTPVKIVETTLRDGHQSLAACAPAKRHPFPAARRRPAEAVAADLPGPVRLPPPSTTPSSCS